MTVSEETKESDDGPGENYFISMTDMMVGMLFIFIILLMAFALAFRKSADVQVVATQQQEATTAEQADKIKIAEDVGNRLAELQSQISAQLQSISESAQQRLALLTQLQQQLAQQGLSVQISASGDVLRLNDQAVHFEPNQFDLSDAAKQNVDKIAGVLALVLPAYAACQTGTQSGCRGPGQAAIETVFIEGHTDTTGIPDNNWPLSAQRAASTYRELLLAAPNLQFIDNRSGQEVLSISGYSSTRPIDSASNLTAYAQNRRIDLRFVLDTDETVGLQQINALMDSMRSAIGELKQ